MALGKSLREEIDERFDNPFRRTNKTQLRGSRSLNVPIAARRAQTGLSPLSQRIASMRARGGGGFVQTQQPRTPSSTVQSQTPRPAASVTQAAKTQPNTKAAQGAVSQSRTPRPTSIPTPQKPTPAPFPQKPGPVISEPATPQPVEGFTQ